MANSNPLDIQQTQEICLDDYNEESNDEVEKPTMRKHETLGNTSPTIKGQCGQ